MLNDANLFLFLVSLVLIVVAALMVVSVAVYHNYTQLLNLRQENLLIMNGLDQLRAANAGLELSVSEGFAAQASALEELASDIANLNNVDPAELQAEVDRISAQASAISTATTGFAQAVRDALPTDVVPNPNPMPEPDPTNDGGSESGTEGDGGSESEGGTDTGSEEGDPETDE